MPHSSPQGLGFNGPLGPFKPSIYKLPGKNVTEEYYKVTPRLNHAMEEAVKVAERKEKNNEVIIISAV